MTKLQPVDQSAMDSRIELAISGMTCASCAGRVERRLSKLPGVMASVNFATERAHVTFNPDQSTVDDLLAAVQAAGYGAVIPEQREAQGQSTVDSAEQWWVRAQVCAVLAAITALFTMVPAVQFSGWPWLAFAAATPVATWGAWPFYRAAWTNLRHASATMDTLIAVGVATSYLWSVWALVIGDSDVASGLMSFDAAMRGAPETYFEVAAVVPVLVLFGRYIEAKAKRRAGTAVNALLALGAKDVGLLISGGEQRIPITALVVGDEFLVRPGEKIATDGTVLDGHSTVDMSMLTGESVPCEIGPGDTVTGGTLNVDGRLIVRASRVGSDTALAHISELVAQAQAGKAAIQRLADRISAIFVPAVVLLAVMTLLGWWLITGDSATGLAAAVAVLIIACPCALGLATPTALLVGTGRGAQLGIFIRGPEVLESTRQVDTVVLDKTGTVTCGQMSVVDVIGDQAALELAGAMENSSEHPVAKAIVAAAKQKSTGFLPLVTEFVNRRGLGVHGLVNGELVVAGQPALLTELGFDIATELTKAAQQAQNSGCTTVFAGWDGQARAVFVVADTVKPSSAEAVQQLRKLGLAPKLLTGDNRQAADAVAVHIGLSKADVIADVRPDEKMAVIQHLQSQGRVVAMVGDGVNDSAALAQADLGVAMSSGTDAAIEASDLTIARDDVRIVVDAIRLARRTLATIKGNLFWAFAYNVVALPIAALGYLNPMIAAAAMAGSSLFVVGNSLRLRRFRSNV